MFMPNRPQSRAGFDPTRVQTGVGGQAQPDSTRSLANDADDAVTWRFHRAANQAWRWEKTVARYGFAQHSSRTFARYQDCVRDAQSAGYRPMKAASNLVPLSLVADPQPIPRALILDTTNWRSEQENRSTVLKKRVAHPVIERLFGKARSPALTRRRTSPLRAHSPSSAGSNGVDSAIRGKTK
jgi:hypothetical protein